MRENSSCFHPINVWSDSVPKTANNSEIYKWLNLLSKWFFLLPVDDFGNIFNCNVNIFIFETLYVPNVANKGLLSILVDSWSIVRRISLNT